jgi:hypothetical protein
MITIQQIYFLTLSIPWFIAKIASLTHSFVLVENHALRVSFNANSIFVEVVSISTGNTKSFLPCYTTLVVHDHFEEFRIFELR